MQSSTEHGVAHVAHVAPVAQAAGTGVAPDALRTGAAVAASGSELTRHIVGSRSGLSLARWRQGAGDIWLTADQMCEHTVVYHAGGSVRVRKLVGRRVVGDMAKLGAISTVPARRDTRWVIDAPVDVVHLYIDPATLDAAALDTRGDSQPAALCEAFARPDPLLARLIECVLLAGHAADRSESLRDDFLLDQVAGTIVCHLADRYLSPDTVAGAGGRATRLAPYKLHRLEEHIAANLSKPLTLEGLAALAGLERHHFLRAFKASTGQTPHRYVMQRRLAAAALALARGTSSVNELARDCGFATASHLCHAFRRQFGRSPTTLRRDTAVLLPDVGVPR